MTKLTIEQEINKVEITDELIAINKEHQKLDVVWEKYEELIDALKESDSVNTVINDFKLDKEIATLEKLQDKVSKKMLLLREQASKQTFLTRMVKGALFIKSLK